MLVPFFLSKLGCFQKNTLKTRLSCRQYVLGRFQKQLRRKEGNGTWRDGEPTQGCITGWSWKILLHCPPKGQPVFGWDRA